mgnify:CR=1 FL=1
MFDGFMKIIEIEFENWTEVMKTKEFLNKLQYLFKIDEVLWRLIYAENYKIDDFSDEINVMLLKISP